jgi:hypothetical protein
MPYSRNCSQLNKIPNEIATKRPLTTIDLQPAKIARCAATNATPDVSKTTVLTRGKANASNVSSNLIPSGGQIPPMVIAGAKLAWKKLQKKGKNNIASEPKNKIIP